MMTREETWARLRILGVVEGKTVETRWNLQGANLRGANLSEADVSGANLRGANLSEAHLWEANLSEADLHEANLTLAYLHEANLTLAYLHEANLTLAYLAGADLSGANLTGANLRDADLSGANLTGANLRDADLSGANLTGTCIDDAYMGGRVIKDAARSHIVELKSSMERRIGAEVLESEKKYERTQKTTQVTTDLSGGTDMNDLQRLIEKYEQRMAELEAQIVALRHKHDILQEALRLLEEETQTPSASSQ